MSRRKSKRQPVEKHIYSSQEIVYSSGWRTEDFRLAEKQRQFERDARKVQDSRVLGELYEIIESENIVSLAHFIRLIYSRYPDLAVVLRANHAQIRDFISSRRYDISCGFTDMPYGKVCEMLKAAQLECVQLDSKVGELWQVIDQDKRTLKSNELELAKLRQSLEESQSFTKYLVERNHELLELLDFEEIPIS